MPTDPVAAWKHLLYTRAARRPEELALAAHSLYGGPPPWTTQEDAGQLDFLDFFVIEWVDAEGWTEVEHAVREDVLPQEALRWPREARSALWVVDGWEGDNVLLRDVRTESEVAVTAPGAQADLVRRTVIRARVVPVGDTLRFSGEPDVYDAMGVIARQDLLRQWLEGPEPALIEHLAALRAGFLRQREERDAWIRHFGSDELVFPNAKDMENRLAPFVSYLNNEHRFPSLGGLTRAEAFRTDKGADPTIMQLALGPTLTGPGRPGVIYDAVEGIHFLPSYGELLAHLRDEEAHPDVVRMYLDDPGITRLPFRRAGVTRALARLLVRPEDEPLDQLLAPYKAASGRASPSVLPGLED
ncbi:MAG: hypothetical protein Q8P18_10445 [Pseudomonadota bacterium]|nr:hypothetical protein [Pseudomonadota bacterium]